jgi:hypothetical protein
MSEFNIELLKSFLFAAFGGVIGYIMRSITSKREICFLRALIEGIAAGFVGMCVSLLCSSIGIDIRLSGAIVGVSGWIGANATVRIIERVIYKRLGIND